MVRFAAVVCSSIKSDPNKNKNKLKNKLLAELQQANEELENEMFVSFRPLPIDWLD